MTNPRLIGVLGLMAVPVLAAARLGAGPATGPAEAREAPPSAARATSRPATRPGDLRRENDLKVGDVAPDFALKTLDGKGEVRLSEFRGKQPVVLVFGSYT